jgi:hypothetical protein
MADLGWANPGCARSMGSSNIISANRKYLAYSEVDAVAFGDDWASSTA